jgi:hypothetical protein
MSAIKEPAMRSMLRASFACMFALCAQSAQGAPCAGFVDVDSTHAFCKHVEWLKNRAVTLGCQIPNSYCPNDPVVRLSMAAFMNRLGTALTPTTLTADLSSGALDIDLQPVVCTTADFAVTGYPRRALLDAGVSGTGPTALDMGVVVVMSTNGGAWTELTAESRGAVLANQWGNVTAIAREDLDVNETVRFGVRVKRVGAVTGDLSDSRCYVRAVVHSRDGAATPF